MLRTRLGLLGVQNERLCSLGHGRSCGRVRRGEGSLALLVVLLLGESSLLRLVLLSVTGGNEIPVLGLVVLEKLPSLVERDRGLVVLSLGGDELLVVLLLLAVEVHE